MSDESLESRIRSWLAKQGYPFELHVGRILRSAGWGIEHAQLFADPETSKVREIDIVASIQTGQPDKGVVSIHWAIECKSAVDHPWVVFTSKGPSEGISPSAPYFAPGMIGTAVMVDAMELGKLTPTYQVTGPIGHGVVRAFGDGKSGDPSGAYSGLLGATAAANALARANGTFWLQHAGDVAILNVFMPAVVIDGSLFEMELTDEGDEILREVGRSLVWCRNPGGNAEASLVNVITVAELSRFAKQSIRDSLEIANRALIRAPDIWRKYRNRSANVPF
jgi:hypothetical protein